MATVNYTYVPGQQVFIVNAAAFGIGRATIVSVQITADPLLTKYVVTYVTGGRSPTLVDEAVIYATLADALVAYGPLVI